MGEPAVKRPTDGALPGEGSWDLLTKQLDGAWQELIARVHEDAIRNDFGAGWRFKVEYQVEHDEATFQTTIRLSGRWEPLL